MEHNNWLYDTWNYQWNGARQVLLLLRVQAQEQLGVRPDKQYVALAVAVPSRWTSQYIIYWLRYGSRKHTRVGTLQPLGRYEHRQDAVHRLAHQRRILCLKYLSDGGQHILTCSAILPSLRSIHNLVPLLDHACCWLLGLHPVHLLNEPLRYGGWCVQFERNRYIHSIHFARIRLQRPGFQLVAKYVRTLILEGKPDRAIAFLA